MSRQERNILLLLLLACLTYPGPLQLPGKALSGLAGPLGSPSQQEAFVLIQGAFLFVFGTLICGQSRP